MELIIAISIVTIRSIWHSMCSIVYVLENFLRTFANLVALTIDIATNCFMRCIVPLFF